jgi:hypothetical protein
VDDAQLGRSGNVHELLLVLDLGVCAVVGVALSLCAGQFAVQLLQALFTEGSQGALVFFKFGNEGIFVVRVFVLLSTIQHSGHAGVDGRHGGVCLVVSSWKGELFRSNKFTVVSRASQARGREIRDTELRDCQATSFGLGIFWCFCLDETCHFGWGTVLSS